MLNDKKLDWLLALTVFLISFGVYFSTMAPTLSFWDCGELIAASHVLGNPHPPGNPLLLLVWRFFIIVVPFAEIAARTNLLSVLTSALVAVLASLIVLKSMRLVFPQGGLNKFALYSGALIAGFLVAFSDSHWFSAVETETGGPSMLFVMLITWLSLRWYELRGSQRADRLMLLIGYLAFLGFGVHLFAFIAMPVFFGMLLLDSESRRNIPLLATWAILFSIIWNVGNFVFYAGGTLLVCIIAAFLSKAPEWRRRWTVSAWLCVVALLGVSSYAYVPIRTNVNVSLDEAEAKTWPVLREYIERKQYGSESMLIRALHRRAHVQNQVLVHPHMGYGGYMLAQYFPWKVGDRDEESVETVTRSVFGKSIDFPTLTDSLGDNPRTQLLFFLLLQIPFLYGGYLVFKRNKLVGTYLLGLYIATSYGLIFYLNFSDGTQIELRDLEYWRASGADSSQMPAPVHMEVRERDYFFTPGFIFMGVLFGVAATFFLNWLAARRRVLLVPTGAVLSLLALAVPVWSNYREHDRTGDYVPYDYAYNLLQSCRPNSILFTNGDNDTFPLWFLQEVEGIRKDVRVVNLSLVNTNWYMHQLRDHEPAIEIGFTPEQIDALQPQPWRFKGPVEISVPGTKIRYQLEPLPYLRVQDIMILHIVQNNFPKRPVHFAVTIGGSNAMGLDQYAVMEGLVYTLTEERQNRAIDVQATARLIDSVYRFRGLGDPKVHINNNTAGLLTNYSATNFRLAAWAQDSLQKIIPLIEAAPAGSAERARLESDRDEVVAFAQKYLNLNAKILPTEWRVHYYAGQLYQIAGKTAESDSAYLRGMSVPGPNARIFAMNLAQSYMQQSRSGEAQQVLASMVDRFPEDLEIAFGLSEIRRSSGDAVGAREALSEWLRRNPKHQYAQQVGAQIQQMESMERAPAAPAPAVP
jgi:Flp pilus assembly protein TadD